MCSPAGRTDSLLQRLGLETSALKKMDHQLVGEGQVCRTDCTEELDSDEYLYV